MSEEAQRMPALGEAGETCRECGAPLAADQRYCLNCGRRRGGPRVDFQRHLPAANGASANGTTPPVDVPPAPLAAAPAEKPERDYAPLAAVGGIAVLGLMLLVGVLIGKGDGGSATAPAPQVVRLQDEGSGTTASDGEAEPGAAAKQAKAKGSGKVTKSAGNLSGAKGGAGGPVEASDDALQELQEQSPEEYRESSAKLPDEIATGGAPPPEDNLAPGGGSKGTAIE